MVQWQGWLLGCAHSWFVLLGRAGHVCLRMLAESACFWSERLVQDIRRRLLLGVVYLFLQVSKVRLQAGCVVDRDLKFLDVEPASFGICFISGRKMAYQGVSDGVGLTEKAGERIVEWGAFHLACLGRY